ncbi:unnamed protein product [Moneuplotes crassus]|uniref:Uncharacterized protein n=1 Tax=Euplotes crassus TaxID=5936 RepID=A0AAD1X6N6_EUPCR|nr:unnamed protein product [Moneuplotes crassus]
MKNQYFSNETRNGVAVNAFKAGKKLCEKYFTNDMKRPMTGFDKRRRAREARTRDNFTGARTERHKFSQKQMMFFDVDLVKIREEGHIRPMTGVPVKAKDPKTGRIILQRKLVEKRGIQSAMRLKRNKTRTKLIQKAKTEIETNDQRQYKKIQKIMKAKKNFSKHKPLIIEKFGYIKDQAFRMKYE